MQGLYIDLLLKSISRNIRFIPCISILFTMKRQSVYDLLLETYVIDK